MGIQKVLVRQRSALQAEPGQCSPPQFSFSAPRLFPQKDKAPHKNNTFIWKKLRDLFPYKIHSPWTIRLTMASRDSMSRSSIARISYRSEHICARIPAVSPYDSFLFRMLPKSLCQLCISFSSPSVNSKVVLLSRGIERRGRPVGRLRSAGGGLLRAR